MEDETPVKKPRKPDKRSTQERTPFQGFRKPDKAYFCLPNEWTDITAEITSLSELKIIEYIARHTWGFREFGTKKEISTDEFMYGRWKNDDTRFDKGTQLSDRGVKDGIELAEKHGYIEVEIDISDKARIRKFYGLKMLNVQSDGKKLPTTSSSVDRKKLPPDRKTLPITRAGTQEETSYRSKKESEKHLEKEEDRLSPSAHRFYADWITLDYPKEAAKVLDAKLAGQCEELAPDVTSREELISLCEYCLKMLPAKNDGKLWAANLIKWKGDWKKDKSQPPPEQQEGDIYYQGMEIPAGVERAIERVCKQKWGESFKHSVINKAFQEIELPPKRFEMLFNETMEKSESPDDVLTRMKRWVTAGTR